MKKILAAVTCVFFLSACSESEKTIDVDLEFIELQKTNDSGKAIFVSNDEEKYYKMFISSFQYNNWDMETGDIITVNKEINGYSYIFNIDQNFYEAVWGDKRIQLYEFDYFLE